MRNGCSVAERSRNGNRSPLGDCDVFEDFDWNGLYDFDLLNGKKLSNVVTRNILLEMWWNRLETPSWVDGRNETLAVQLRFLLPKNY